MQVVEYGPFDTILDVMLDADGHPQGHGRPGGIHASHCIQRYRKIRGAKDGPQGEQDGVRMYMGFLWEWALELAFKAIGFVRSPLVLKQLRLEVDEIHMTLDGLDVEHEEPILEESKLTWRSMRWLSSDEAKNPLTLAEALSVNFWSWMMQVMAYLHGASVHLGRPVRVVRLYILFVMGDYSFQKKRGPQVRVFELRFTDEEVATNWKLMVQLRDMIKREAQ